MIRVPLGTGAYRRSYGDLPEVRMENRFFEANPSSEEGSALLTRPGTEPLFGVSGTAPFRAVYSKEGVFGGDLFYACAGGLYRYALGDVPQLITGSPAYGDFDITFAASAGLYYAHLFVAYDGGLSYYAGEGYAKAYVAYDPINPPLDQTVRVGSVYYQFRGAGSVDAVAGDGSSGTPYLLDYDDSLPSVFDEWKFALQILEKAINATGTPGTDYSSALTTAHGAVHATFKEVFGVYLDLQSRLRGSSGDLIGLQSVSGSIPIGNASGGTVTTGSINFEGGGVHELVPVLVPGDVEIDRVVTLGAFVLAIERDSNRFFFIRPGEVEIAALDYESAEAEPDIIADAVTAGDFAYLFGRSSVEVWYVAGDADRPIQRVTGGAYRVGAVEGTAVVVQTSPVFVGTDNLVYALGGGAPQRISDHGIEERLRASGLLRKVAWSFTLDGHFFYVLTIEDQGTFVYDATVQQWYHWWAEAEDPYWTGVRGAQWRTFALCIDWSGADVWHVNPAIFTDGSPAEDMTRVVTGFLPRRERRIAKNSLVRVFASIGNHDGLDPAPSLALRFSDDNGETWRGPYEVELSDTALQQLDFRSLGAVGFPGRLFEISDTAGLLRIDAVYAQLD